MQNIFNLFKAKGQAYRDPRYVVIAGSGLLILALMTFQTIHTRQKLDGFEMSIFSFFNNWPLWLQGPFYAITQFGTLAAVTIWASLAIYLRNLRAGVTVAVAGALSWFVAKPLKVWVGRGRPQDLLKLPHLIHIERFVGQGFPSGHATVVAACITSLLFFVDRSKRKFLYVAAGLVGISRIYLGAHFPRDVLGGYALGMAVGGLVSLLLGTAKPTVSITPIKKRLAEMGINAKSVRRLNVDARGSIPMQIEASDNKRYIAKLFGKQEYVADWLFKAVRFFKFKSFGDERPYLNSKHNVEHEALASMWAARAGVQTPAVRGYALAGGYWMLVQDFVDATSLDRVAAKQISDKVLERTWQQVKTLHEANIAHRDLRAANILVDKDAQPWLIDFGFAEVAARSVRQRMDVAELLMSTALVVGKDRASRVAQKVLGRRELLKAAPYVQMPVFSAATRSAAKRNKAIYDGLREELNQLSDQPKVEKAEVLRLNSKKLINVAVFGVFLFVILPQLGAFRGALHSLSDISLWWLLPILGFSALTYLSSAMTTVSLAPTPLKVRDATSVQVASSFVSKLLPAGLGSMTLFLRFLRRSGMTTATATSILATEALMGFATFILPLSLILLLNGRSITSLIKIKINPLVIMVVVIGLIAAVVIVCCVKQWRKKVLEKVHQTLADLKSLASSPSELALAAAFSLGVTLSYAACLYVCLAAVGLHLSPVAVLLVYATATIAGSAIPTPGGLGALEVAMAAALVGMGYSQGPAYAAVILYRLASFWTPIPVGFFAYQYIQKKKLI